MSKHIQHTKASFSHAFEYKWVYYGNLKLKRSGQQYREKSKRKHTRARGLATWWRTKGGLFDLGFFRFAVVLFWFSSNPCLPLYHKKIWTIWITISSHCCCSTATETLQPCSFPSCFAHSCLTASFSALPQGQHRVHQEHSKIGAMISVSVLVLQPGAAIAVKWIQL